MASRSPRRYTVKPPIREWLPKIQIGRAYRPSYGTHHGVIPAEAVRNWIIGVKEMGARSVICLLSGPELEWYSHLPGGLLGTYQAADLESVGIPVPMDIPGVLNAEHLKQLEEAFLRLPKPVVIHCHAGLVRSGAAIAHLVTHHNRLVPTVPPALEAQILRLIRNSKREHTTCALRSGAYGLADYGLLAHLLVDVPFTILSAYLDEIDTVRRSHQSCLPCSLKFLSFCQVFSDHRLPQRNEEYRSEFQRLRLQDRSGRDFMQEIQEAIRNASPNIMGAARAKNRS